MLTGSIFDALIAGNIADNIVIIKDIKNTKIDWILKLILLTRWVLQVIF